MNNPDANQKMVYRCGLTTPPGGLGFHVAQEPADRTPLPEPSYEEREDRRAAAAAARGRLDRSFGGPG
jgi:hypothetical protein